MHGHVIFYILIIFMQNVKKKIIANIFVVIHLASCQGAFEVEQQLLNDTGPALTKEPFCESQNTHYITLSPSGKKK